MIDTFTEIPVLVTGAAGFIGSHLANRLAAEGAIVHAVGRPGGDWSRLDESEHIHRHEVDLAHSDDVASLLNRTQPVKIYHLAANADVSRGFGTLDKAVGDLDVTLNLIRCLPDLACDCMVVTGTCEEYGKNPTPFREDMAPMPVSPYSASKTASVSFALMYAKTMDLPIVMVRPFLTYGPGQGMNRFIPTAIRATLEEKEFPMTGGEQTREFNYVDDIVDGYVKASITPDAIGEIFNIGNSEERSLRSVVERISVLAGKPLRAEFGAVPYRPGETWSFYSDSSKARKLLGWKPQIEFDEGLKRTIEWYRKHGYES